MDLKPFKLDIDDLINEFAEGESTTLADMKKVWLSRKFSFIFEARPSTNVAFFMQSLYAHSIGYMVSTASLSHRLGGLYCLYCLYETQPFKPPFKIYLSLGELKRLKNLVGDAKAKGIKVVAALIKKMLEMNLFLFGFVDMNEGSITERVNELTYIQNARIQVAYEKLFANTRIEHFIHMDLGKELEIDALKKMSTGYAEAKEQAIREASQVVDVENIKHIAENQRLIGDVVGKTVGDWNCHKESFYQQTGLNQLPAIEAPTQQEDNDKRETADQEGNEDLQKPGENERFKEREDGENSEQVEDIRDFGEEIEQLLFHDSLPEV